MLVKHQKEFNRGAMMAIGFVAVLTIMFMPVFNGGNAFNAADQFFNSIAKGSTYYIDRLKHENEEFRGHNIDVTFKLEDEELARKARELFFKAGATVSGENGQLSVKGGLAQILDAVIQDSDAMFYNKGEEIAAKYGFPEKEVMVAWHTSLKGVMRALTKQEKFDEVAHIREVMERGVEVGYNFYKIEPKKAISSAGALAFSLIFYVVYTLWWGYAILYLFDGLGLQMKAGKKKEV